MLLQSVHRQIDQAKQVLEAIRNTLKEDKKRAPQAGVIDAFIATTAAVLLHLHCRKRCRLPRISCPACLWPAGFALYVEAHSLYLQKNYEKSIGS